MHSASAASERVRHLSRGKASQVRAEMHESPVRLAASHIYLYRSHPTRNHSRARWNAAHALSQSVAIMATPSEASKSGEPSDFSDSSPQSQPV
jgi:hypothetical protein